MAGWVTEAMACQRDKTAFHHEGETIYRCNLLPGKKECRLSNCPKREKETADGA